MSGTVSLSVAGTRKVIGVLTLAQPLISAVPPGSRREHAFDVQSGAQQLRVDHQGHEPASG